MGLLYRCSACEREMVLESYHRARVVPCPWCGAQEEIPENLEFSSVAVESRADANKGKWLLACSVGGLFVSCLPLCAFCWWASAGRIAHAREQQREADALLLNARVLGAVGTILHGLAWALFAVTQFAVG